MNIQKEFIGLVFVLMPSIAFGQSEMPDSVATNIENTQNIHEGRVFAPDSISAKFNFRVSDSSRDSFGTGVTLPSMSISGPFATIVSYMMVPGYSAPYSWNGGGLFGSAYSSDFPGLMRYDSANLGVFQTLGDFTVYAGGIANRYGNYWGGIHTQFGVEASMAYQITPWLAANAFGTYYFGSPQKMSNGMPMTPAMAGFYGRSNFGATMDFQINEHWGVEAGARMVRQMDTNRFEAEPIATPYYKINNKVKIGLPVGQILYHLIRKR